jgi:hypothetical protein
VEQKRCEHIVIQARSDADRWEARDLWRFARATPKIIGVPQCLLRLGLARRGSPRSRDVDQKPCEHIVTQLEVMQIAEKLGTYGGSRARHP